MKLTWLIQVLCGRRLWSLVWRGEFEPGNLVDSITETEALKAGNTRDILFCWARKINTCSLKCSCFSFFLSFFQPGFHGFIIDSYHFSCAKG